MPIECTDIKCPHCGGIVNDLDGLLQCLDYARPDDLKGCGTFWPKDDESWDTNPNDAANWFVQDWHGRQRFFSRARKLALNNVRYNLLLMPIVFAIYLPYNLLFIGYSPLQLVKWMTTAGILSFFANVVLQPWQSLCYRRKWLK